MFIGFRERGMGRERETLIWERNINRLPPVHALNGNQTHNLGVGTDRELNLQPFSAQDDASTNWAIRPGHHIALLNSHHFTDSEYFIWYFITR